MSRANFATFTVTAIALVAATACASGPNAPELTPEQEAYQAAMEAASRPASPEQIAAAERSDPLTRANFWAEEYRKNAADEQTIITFMRALRRIGSYDRVIDVATKALPIHPGNYEILLELGRSQLAKNSPQEAAAAFVRSADLAPVDIAAPLAALGVAFDRMENHNKAQEAYRLALQREPDRISTLSNYGLSLALSGDLINAEAQLRTAAALPGANMRVRQNLALVLGLQGRFDEMAAVDPDAPSRTIEANRQALRAMMIPERSNTAIGSEAEQPDADIALRPKLRGSQNN